MARIDMGQSGLEVLFDDEVLENGTGQKIFTAAIWEDLTDEEREAVTTVCEAHGFQEDLGDKRGECMFLPDEIEKNTDLRLYFSCKTPVNALVIADDQDLFRNFLKFFVELQKVSHDKYRITAQPADPSTPFYEGIEVMNIHGDGLEVIVDMAQLSSPTKVSVDDLLGVTETLKEQTEIALTALALNPPTTPHIFEPYENEKFPALKKEHDAKVEAESKGG